MVYKDLSAFKKKDFETNEKKIISLNCWKAKSMPVCNIFL